MARGIHLKQLRSADLEAIGVPDDTLSGRVDDEDEPALSLLAEADPVLSRALDEVCRGLETTLQLLDEALSANTSSQAPSLIPEK